MKFHKTYTRDTTIPIQEAWLHTNTIDIEEKIGIKNPHEPFTFYYRHHGTLEIWEHENYIPWIRETVRNFFNSQPERVVEILNEYEKEVAKITEYWKQGAAASIEELIELDKRVNRLMFGYFTMYYGALTEGTPDHLRALAVRLRDADMFFDGNDTFFRASLESLYPHLRGYVSCIFAHELSNPPTLDECKKRSEGMYFFPNKEIFFGTRTEFLAKYPNIEFQEDEVPANVQSIKGSVGFAGHVTGRVKIVWSKNDAPNVQDGDILVSPMTTPAILPAMKKAAAFVTDEGGVTCHAAIVARELKKPCVIGTKVATKVLKDGDEVEVDAEKGIVTILKRA